VVGEPAAIDADGAKLSFMLEELLTNAVRFSPPGGQISCRMREVTVDGRGLRHYLEMSVSDQGRGIAPEDHDRIFKVFERTTPSETANGTLGLGLPLVKRFVDLHGGRIWLTSAPGEGSTFTILIPYGGVSHVERENPRIVLCDPDDNFAAMVSHYLGEEGWSVQRASDGFALLQHEAPADLFLIALDSPAVGGIDLCLRLKADLATLHVPVLVLAPQGGEQERPKAFQVGCDGFFVKPVEFEELVPVVRTLVRRKMEFEFLKKSCEAAELQACTDALTGLCNLRQLMVVLERELERSRRYGRECSLAMIDIDWFKHYNDTYGHLAGDEILVAAAGLFRGDIRNSDLAARYGGEEFVVLMPETGKPLAGRVGEKLRQVFEEFPFPHEESQPGGRLTISMGIATFPADAATPRELLDRADQALYEAKRRGRNCLVLWGE
jgi:diguanylate cyclase (GGDEF)-like protein